MTGCWPGATPICWIRRAAEYASATEEAEKMGYLFVALTILFTAYGQLAIKWQVGLAGPLPDSPEGKLGYFVRLLLNPWIVSAIFAAFAAMLCWMGAMTKFELSKAYPFMALNFVVVGAASIWLFNEQPTLPKFAGVALIVLGLVVVSRG
jgi:multidrug transporter EmrE-like cation transporter